MLSNPTLVTSVSNELSNANHVLHNRLWQDSESQFGEFPWMAIIMEEEYVGGQQRHRYVCGGSLITRGVILTAAHCVKG